MDRETAAAALDGSKYREEGSKELFAAMKEAGLVAVFGASDDLMEFRGAIYDEAYPSDDDPERVTSAGLFKGKCENDNCPYDERERARAVAIHAKWDDGGFSWRYETAIPHSTFVIMEDDEPYCQGIVFALSDVPNE